MLALAFCLCGAWALAALPPMPERLDREKALERVAQASRADAPDANTLTVAQAQWTEYAEDGRDTVWAEFWSKALTEPGAQELRTVPLWFKQGYSISEFQLAEVIHADGSATPIDLEANVAEASSNSGNDANIYDPTSRRLMLSVPKVEVGDTLHVILCYRTLRPRIPDSYYETILFQSFGEPVPYSVATVVSPKALPLKSVALLDEVPGTVTASRETLADGRILHRWVARGVPQAFAEPKMPDTQVSAQRVSLSTFDSWEALSKWYWTLCDKHMRTTPAIDAKVAALTQGKDRAAQIEALFAFVAQEVRYMGIIAEDEAPGFEPHDVALTFDNRYGVCRDKGVLLVAMLRKAGFDAFPVIIHAGSPRDAEVPMPYFNHAVGSEFKVIVAVERHCKVGKLAATVIVVEDKAYSKSCIGFTGIEILVLCSIDNFGTCRNDTRPSSEYFGITPSIQCKCVVAAVVYYINHITVMSDFFA